MAEVMASAAATSVMGSVIGKLAAMLTDKYKLAKDVERGIRFLQEELSSMDAVLQMLAEKDDDQIHPCANDWRSKVRELYYDIEDCIDRFMLNHSQGGSKPNFVRKAMRKVKSLFKDGGIAEEIQELKTLISEQSERGRRYYNINQCLTPSPQPVLLDPRAPALFQEAMDLVGVDGPREEVIQILKCEDKEQDKVVSIYGIGGQGKTTLAMEVYHKITEAFDCRAFVTVSQTPDMKKLLRDILSQISQSDFDRSRSLETVEQLIRTLRECLKDKRYFILIDDIWKENAWYNVRSALPLNNNGSRIITTTRIKAVGNLCCTGISAQMYEAKPLSDDDSQRLFFKRLFCSSDDCHPDLRRVCSDILKKCSGLPLAIISIAGILANRSKTLEVWGNVLRSISAAADKGSLIDKMKRVLLLSYFDLSHHLKSCLLYLSVFPEDYSIDCRQLILLWVAEGLIPGQDRESMEQLGRSYLNELINRSLVEPTKIGVDGTTVKQCRVHDVILEFIVSKAVEDNFVTIWNGDAFSKNYYSSNKPRRLSIQKDIYVRAEEIAMKIRNGAHIRSIHIFGSNFVLVKKHASEFLNSQVLRVLNIEGAVLECNIAHVNHLGQLKYLRTDLLASRVQLPEDIERLQHLETLDVRSGHLENLPACIIRLQRLVRLFVDYSVQLPDGIRNLQALEELSKINLGIQSVQFIQGLGDLTNLRVLGIDWIYSTEVHDKEGHRKACISTLSKLFKHLRELRVRRSDHDATCSFMASCVPTPPPLQRLVFRTHNLNRVGPQISSLVNLSRLYVCAYGKAGKEGINILASLPMLLSLTVDLSNDKDGDSDILYARHVVCRHGFQRLLKFNLCFGSEAALEFEAGAMPKLQRLKLRLMARFQQLKYGEGGIVHGLQNLDGLKHVAIEVNCIGAVADQVDALEDNIRCAVASHPNSPVLHVQRSFQEWMAYGCNRCPPNQST